MYPNFISAFPWSNDVRFLAMMTSLFHAYNNNSDWRPARRLIGQSCGVVWGVGRGPHCHHSKSFTTKAYSEPHSHC